MIISNFIFLDKMKISGPTEEFPFGAVQENVFWDPVNFLGYRQCCGPM